MKIHTTMFLIGGIFCSPTVSEAGLGQFLKKGVQLITKGTGKATRETAESGVKRLTAKTVPKAGTPVAQQTVKATGLLLTPQIVVTGSKTIARTTKTWVDDLGVGGAKALQKLSPEGTKKLAAVSGDLAKSSYRKQWLDVLAKHGDSAANFLWRNKAKLAVGVGASAVLLQPAEFLKTTGQVLESTIETGSKHMIRPMVVNLTDRVVTPVAKEISTQAAASFPWRLFWTAILAGITVSLGLIYRKRKSVT